MEFSDSNAARLALESLNSQPIPGTNGVCHFLPYRILPYLCILATISVKKVQTELGKSQGGQWVRFASYCCMPVSMCVAMDVSLSHRQTDYNVFVADLSRDVTSQQLSVSCVTSLSHR